MLIEAMVIGMVSLGSLTSQQASAPCSPDLAAVGICAISNSGSQIDIGASMTIPGGGSGGDARSGGSGPDRDASDIVSPAPAPGADEGCVFDPCRENYTVVGPPDVTIDDLVSFRPSAPILTGQPAGFGVVGMPANVVASASEQFLVGEILGWDVTVRFTPAAYVFSYGDGAVVRSASGGASWEQLGQAQFTPTATSHVYRDRGTYPVTVAVEYAPAVNFGSGTWRPVDGVVTAIAGGYDVQVVAVRTALVDRTCVEDRHGPGC